VTLHLVKKYIVFVVRERSFKKRFVTFFFYFRISEGREETIRAWKSSVASDIFPSFHRLKLLFEELCT